MAIHGASPAALRWSSLICALGALAALWCGWRRWSGSGSARAQGLPGTVYSFPSGDMKEFGRLAAAACSRRPGPCRLRRTPSLPERFPSTTASPGSTVMSP
ncbi:hypothetical protein PAHAL_5G235600 [Panicum hallii]|uniref:Uncharacterized protein n=1 Tax=Panicum hallii TaxID=206008 RepID=A0A2S3HTR4_9POAL|nr:hypothetical protein PAHAL_5G235600 [Panicum hallii]